jgi:hypothetical protein
MATARPNVVLLSSLETPKIWYHSKKWKIEKTLNKIFYKRFKKSGLNIIIKEKVDQETLRKELLNPKNIAVFWVSHAKDNQDITSGVSSDAAIVDYYGVDVKDHFKNIHPNMRYVGLVGCNAKNLLQEYRDEGHYSNNKDLLIHSFDKKVDARIGLRKSIRKSAKQIGKLKKRLLATPRVIGYASVFDEFNDSKACMSTQKGFKINVTRELKEDSPVVAIKAQDKILHVFPQGKAGDIQNAEVYIQAPLAEISRNTFKITVDTNLFSNMTKLYLGNFDFNADWNGDWKIFAKRNGIPLGVSKNLYRYKGQTPTSEDLSEFRPYECL